MTEFGARINSGALGINHKLEKPKKFTLSGWFLAPTSQAAVTLAAQRDFSISFSGFSQDWSCPNVCATRRHQPPQDLQRATRRTKERRPVNTSFYSASPVRRASRDAPSETAAAHISASTNDNQVMHSHTFLIPHASLHPLPWRPDKTLTVLSADRRRRWIRTN